MGAGCCSSLEAFAGKGSIEIAVGDENQYYQKKILLIVKV